MNLIEQVDLLIERESQIDNQLSKAGKLSSVDPVLAKVIVHAGLKDGSKSDDKITVSKKVWPSSKLKPSQTTMILAKSIGMALKMIESGDKEGDLAAIVSSDNFIMDGHHRWSANVLAFGKVGKVGGLEANVEGGKLLKILNLLTKGLFKKNVGKRGAGKLSDYTPANVKKMLEDFVMNGIEGDFPLTPEYVQEQLEKQWGDVEAGISGMSSNAKLITKTVPKWAPNRVDMPVIDPHEVPTAGKFIRDGKVDHMMPHMEGVAYPGVPVGKIYPRWSTTWGKEPSKLPRKGSAVGFYSALDYVESDADIVDLAKRKGAVIGTQEKGKFKIWTMGKDGSIFGSHVTRPPIQKAINGYRWVHFFQSSYLKESVASDYEVDVRNGIIPVEANDDASMLIRKAEGESNLQWYKMSQRKELAARAKSYLSMFTGKELGLRHSGGAYRKLVKMAIDASV